jgi:hypothetical protein
MQDASSENLDSQFRRKEMPPSPSFRTAASSDRLTITFYPSNHPSIIFIVGLLWPPLPRQASPSRAHRARRQPLPSQHRLLRAPSTHPPPPYTLLRPHLCLHLTPLSSFVKATQSFVVVSLLSLLLFLPLSELDLRIGSLTPTIFRSTLFSVSFLSPARVS